MFIVTRDWINKNKTPAGAWNKAQIESLGIEWPPKKGWIDKLEGKTITVDCQLIFENSREKTLAVVKREITLKQAFRIVIDEFEKLTCDDVFILRSILKVSKKGKK